ncbi:AAA family ATPase [Falsigemmobacter intermedius]|uniref:AAA family ATPase n=1 Tax=Falsigemmobacter intermedius TaxID=1553448 RepID=A0A3S3Y6H3_9RHOB|nr:AAA family ATPase [Falsigemmobacter intermedius]RWY34456.1 AAA family ATPase [Falsigemmobacter intermedius]
MTLTTHTARVLLTDLPAQPDLTEREIRERLTATLVRIRARRPKAGQNAGRLFDMGSEQIVDDLNELLYADADDAAPLSMADQAKIHDRAKRYIIRRNASLNSSLSHLKDPERKVLLAAAAAGFRATGVLSGDQVDERIAALHADFPWLAPASVAVMQHLRLRCAPAARPAHLPPLLLVGPPGVAKSTWARRLADIFSLVPVLIDIGATSGATFAISGVERGWSSAAPGRVISTMLRERVANPVVILDEIDKIPDSVGTNRGSFPSAFEVLKSMIEPASAGNWICPFYQLPFDLTGVSWIMTTNSIDHLPPAFLDRVRVIEVGRPSEGQLMKLAAQLVAQQMDGSDHEQVLELIRGMLHQRQRSHRITSLRTLQKMIESLCARLTAPGFMH